MIRYLLPVIALVAARVNAQPMEQLRAPEAEFIVLGLQGTSQKAEIVYTLDRGATGRFTKPLRSGMYIASKQGTGVNVMLDYLNPITTSWSLTDSTAVSAVSAASSAFFAAAASLVNSLGGAAGSGGSGTGNTSVYRSSYGSRTRTFALAASGTGSLALISFRNLVNSGCLVDSTQRKALDNQVARLDSVLYVRKQGKRAERRGVQDSVASDWLSSVAYRDSLVAAMRQLTTASNMDELRRAIKNGTTIALLLENTDAKAREILIELTKSTSSAIEALEDNALSKKQIDDLKANLKQGDSAKVSNALLPLQCAGIKRQAQLHLDLIDVESSEVLARRTELIGQLNSLLTSTTDLLNGVSPGDSEFTLGTFIPDEDHDRSICITIQRKNVDLNADEFSVTDLPESKTCFRLVRSSDVVFEVAPGVAFTRLGYSQYGTADGKVAQAMDEIQRVIPTVMLNILPRATSGKVIGQLGIGSGDLAPVLLAGTGVRFTSRPSWTLSLGAIWSMNRYLKTLSVGDPVDGTAAVLGDVGREIRGKPGFYIAMQVGLP